MARLLPEHPEGSSRVTAGQLQGILVVSSGGVFRVAAVLLCGTSIPCMGHPWEAPGLKHLAALVVSSGRQSSLAWTAMFRSSLDLKHGFFIA